MWNIFLLHPDLVRDCRGVPPRRSRIPPRRSRFPSSGLCVTHPVSHRPPQPSCWHPLLVTLSCITTLERRWQANQCGFLFKHRTGDFTKMWNIRDGDEPKRNCKLFLKLQKNLASILKRGLWIPSPACMSRCKRSSCISVVMSYRDTLQLKCQAPQWNVSIKPDKILETSTSRKWSAMICGLCSEIGAEKFQL